MNVKLRLLFLVSFLFVVSVVTAQPLTCPFTISNTITISAPATVCPGQCTQLIAHATNNVPTTDSYRVDSFPYQPYPYNAGTVYTAPFDDDYGGVVHLPFPFCFYGSTYSAIIIGTNGEISFDTTFATMSCPWPINNPLPLSNTAATQNCIMGAYYDLFYVDSGTIYYATYGTAPCRTFVVSNYQVPLYQPSSPPYCPGRATQQIVLHESTNQIDVNIADKPQCTGWNNGYAILGVENAGGNSFVTAPGKNATNWSGTDLSYSFIPTGSGNGGVLYQWYDPAGNLVATGDTVTVCPFGNTQYKVKATVYSGCDSFILYDSTTVHVNPLPVVSFTDSIDYGCAQDTVIFINQTTGGATYKWSFNDNSFIDTNYSPTHIFTTQDTFAIKLIATTIYGCLDSSSQNLILYHPLKASFTEDKDSICQNNTVSFTNTSTYTSQKGNPSYYWDFGDGSTDTTADPHHTYTRSGVFRVMMAIKNFVPCYDTAYATINVDTVTFINVTISDSILCQGSAITFNGTYSTLGNIGTVWDFGDGTIIHNEATVQHAYESAGVYHITFTSDYRICPDTTFPKDITVFNYPLLNLGPDTSLCPGSGGIPIGDFINGGNHAASWIWNTGDTTSGITATQPGVYYTTVKVNGCTTSDSVWVKNDCYIDIPNVFSPNNDGVNDYFFPRQLLTSSVTTFEMVIYNRWGQEIFDTKSIDGRGWDGKLNNVDQPEGVYIYVIDVSFKDGHAEHHQGNITLLR